jgi:hypothetical protein
MLAHREKPRLGYLPSSALEFTSRAYKGAKIVGELKVDDSRENFRLRRVLSCSARNFSLRFCPPPLGCHGKLIMGSGKQNCKLILRHHRELINPRRGGSGGAFVRELDIVVAVLERN